MRVFLITGFALDKRAFDPLHLPAEPYELIDLIPILKGETLQTYAGRMAKVIGLKEGDIVGGVSLGGMLALEMAKIIRVRGVILIASATHPKFIRNPFLTLAPIAPFVPDFLIRQIFKMVPRILKWQRMLSPEGQALLTDIMGQFPPSLLRQFPPLIRKWPGCTPPENFLRIHSDGDWLIKPDGYNENKTLLKGKNHLITVSHPKEVRAFILKAVKEFTELNIPA